MDEVGKRIDADGISEALGHDPLLIALHEPAIAAARARDRAIHRRQRGAFGERAR
jgi:hypothetical protein